MSSIVQFAESRVLVDYLAQMGVSGPEIRKRTGMTSSQLLAPERGMPIDRAYGLWRLAIEVSGDEALALRLRQVSGMSLESAPIALSRYYPRLCDSIECAIRYFRAIERTFSMELRREGSTYSYSFDFTHPIYRDRIAVEFCLATLLQGSRESTGTELRPIHAYFQHRKPRHSKVYEEVFGCPISFGEARNTLVFRSEDMALPLRARNESQGRSLLTRLSSQLACVEASEVFLEGIQNVMARGLAKGRDDSFAVAAELGISRTTLYRRLSERGTSYRDLLRELRQRLAVGYLKEERKAAEIAELLGFAEPAAFHHAFSSWFGISPLAFAERQGATA